MVLLCAAVLIAVEFFQVGLSASVYTGFDSTTG